jgi:hypothetical protein
MSLVIRLRPFASHALQHLKLQSPTVFRRYTTGNHVGPESKIDTDKGIESRVFRLENEWIQHSKVCDIQAYWN